MSGSGARDAKVTEIELFEKRFPGGRLSVLLEGSISPGDTIGYTGPYGSLRARDSRPSVLMRSALCL